MANKGKTLPLTDKMKQNAEAKQNKRLQAMGLTEAEATQLQTEVKAEAEEKKQKRTRPDRKEALTVHTEPGENRKYISHSMQIASLPIIDTNDPKQVESRVYDYFTICADNDMKPSFVGLALAFGVDRVTLWKWVNGVENNKSQEVRNIIKMATTILNNQMEDYIQNGKINVVAGIFLSKNHYAYKDQSEVVLTPNQVTEQTESTLLEASELLPED